MANYFQSKMSLKDVGAKSRLLTPRKLLLEPL